MPAIPFATYTPPGEATAVPLVLNFNNLAIPANMGALINAWNALLHKCDPTVPATAKFGIRAIYKDQSLCLAIQKTSLYIQGVSFYNAMDVMGTNFTPLFEFTPTEESYNNKPHVNFHQGYFTNCFKQDERTKLDYARDAVRGIALIISEAARFELIRDVVINIMTTTSGVVTNGLNSTLFESILLNWAALRTSPTTIVNEATLIGSALQGVSGAAITIREIINDFE